MVKSKQKKVPAKSVGKVKVGSTSKNQGSNIFVRATNKFGSLSKGAQVLVLALVVGVIGGGGYAVYNSYAAVPYLNSTQCYLLGRVYTGSTTGNPCANTCLKGAGSMVTASPYNYCNGALSKISSTTCASLNRVWINNGCARRWQQQTMSNVSQCKKNAMNYLVAKTVDKCTFDTNPSPLTCTIAYSKTPNTGIATSYTFHIRNTSTSRSVKTSGSIYSFGSGALTQTSMVTLSPGQSTTLSTSFTVPSSTTAVQATLNDWSTQSNVCLMDWAL